MFTPFFAPGFEPVGGVTGSRWKIISNQGAPKPVRNEKSCELYPVSRQYIAKANRTPASKLAASFRDFPGTGRISLRLRNHYVWSFTLMYVESGENDTMIQ